MMDRAKAMSIIHSTIRDKKVQNVLSINGWDEDNDDPKYPFDFIKNSISSVTNEAKSDVLDEYQTIKCASFATLEAFLMRCHSFIHALAVSSQACQGRRLQDRRHCRAYQPFQCGETLLSQRGFIVGR
ncbi:hypothetical protein SMAC4_13067 [Sordaria macrospora]|nr:hypothetical protein SMAC4_13067 [Sordaria macrospora]